MGERAEVISLEELTEEKRTKEKQAESYCEYYNDCPFSDNYVNNKGIKEMCYNSGGLNHPEIALGICPYLLWKRSENDFK